MKGSFKLAALSFLLTLGAAPDRRQSVPVLAPYPAPPTLPDQPIQGAADVVDLYRSLGRMSVKIRLGEHGPHKFLIDTGAQRTSISRDLAQKLGLKPGPDVRLISMSGAAKVSTFEVPQIRLSANAVVHNVMAPALDPVHLGAAGLLGVDALAGQRVVIDLQNREMKILPSRKFIPRSTENEIVVIAEKVAGRLILTNAYYGRHRVSVIVDTGSAVTIGNSALRRRLVNDGTTEQQISMVSVIGGRVQADYGRIRHLRLGRINLRDVPIAFADVAPFRELGMSDRPAIMLGMDVVQKFDRVEIDFEKQSILFSVQPSA